MNNAESDAIAWYLAYLYNLSRDGFGDSNIRLERLSAYVFCYCQEWMTEPERKTLLFLALRHYAVASTSQKEYQAYASRANRLGQDTEVTALMSQGEEAFLRSVRDRLLREQGQRILNLCPRCGELARTNKARQCPACFYRW